MTSKFSILRLLLLTALLLGGCAGKAPAVGPVKESVFSDYLFAVYASNHGDMEIASRSYAKVLKENPTSLPLMEEAFPITFMLGIMIPRFRWFARFTSWTRKARRFPCCWQ